MRAANKKLFLPISALFLVLAFVAPNAQAQSFGGTTGSSLTGASSASVFQNPGGTAQGGVSAQGSNAAVLQTSGLTLLAVSGAPASSTPTSEYDEMDTSNEIYLLAAAAGLFAVGVLLLLYRQIKNSY
jgi:hypothetical protein